MKKYLKITISILFTLIFLAGCKQGIKHNQELKTQIDTQNIVEEIYIEEDIMLGGGTVYNTGWKSPSNFEDPDSVWDNETDAYADGGNFASSTFGLTNCRLRFYDFNFDLPDEAEILGIGFRTDVWKRAGDVTNIQFKYYMSQDGGSTYPSDNGYLLNGAWITTSETSEIRDSEDNLWGLSWSTTTLTNANFRLTYNINEWYTPNQHLINIDYSAVKIYYAIKPYVSSVADSPDPVDTGSEVSFETTWALSPNSSASTVKIKVCKTDSLTDGICDGGFYASSTAFTATNPTTTPPYITSGADSGTNSYYAYSCDDYDWCSATSTAGSFTVNTDVTPGQINIKPNGTIKIKPNGNLKIN